MSNINLKPKRILHVLGGMGIGGIETWIMNVFRRINKEEIVFDFLVATQSEKEYDKEILKLGGHIYRSPRYGKIILSSKVLYQTIKKYGPFYAVHVHGRSVIGLQLLIAKLANVSIRVGHVHNLTQSNTTKLKFRIWNHMMKILTIKYATSFLGCSTEACDSYFGKYSTRRLSKVHFLPYGINLDNFKNDYNKSDVFNEFNINLKSNILGHIGNFRSEKNHQFIIDVFNQLLIKDSNWILFLIGLGNNELEKSIINKVKNLNLSKYVIFTGQRTDIPRLVSSFNVFIFPSISEGFGLVVLENQALGIPTIVSNMVPEETSIIPDLSYRIDLNENINKWVSTIINASQISYNKIEAQKYIANSVFNINNCVDKLVHDYYQL